MKKAKNTTSESNRTKAGDTTNTNGEYSRYLALLDVIRLGLKEGIDAAFLDHKDPNGIWSTCTDPWDYAEKLTSKLTGRKDTKQQEHTTSTKPRPEGSRRVTANILKLTDSHSNNLPSGQTKKSPKK